MKKTFNCGAFGTFPIIEFDTEKKQLSVTSKFAQVETIDFASINSIIKELSIKEGTTLKLYQNGNIISAIQGISNHDEVIESLLRKISTNKELHSNDFPPVTRNTKMNFIVIIAIGIVFGILLSLRN